MRNFTDLSELTTLAERFEYLSLFGKVGESTFGYERVFNQQFYRSAEWREVRNYVIARDEGMDLGSTDIPIQGRYPLVHHMNPLTMYDLEHGTPNLLDPEFLISTSLRTHNAIHFGNEDQLPRDFVERRPGDTTPWLRSN